MHRKYVAIFALVYTFFAVIGCAGEVDAASAMRRAGYTDVVVTNSHYFGAAWAGCSRDDNTAFDVSATAVNKQRVTAVVCCGTWKRCTIRF